MNNTILEYLEGYFGGELNESTSDEDIMEAFNELLETADAVEEFMIQEGPRHPRPGWQARAAARTATSDARREAERALKTKPGHRVLNTSPGESPDGRQPGLLTHVRKQQ